MDAIADDMFKVITSAGLKCGMTLRPQVLTISPDWNPPATKPFKYLFRPN